MARLTAERRAEYLRGLRMVATVMQRVSPETKNPDLSKPGTDAHRLYGHCEWMAPILEEIVFAHVSSSGEAYVPGHESWPRRYLPTFTRWAIALFTIIGLRDQKPGDTTRMASAQRMTKRRRAGLVEHLATLKRLSPYFLPETTATPAEGDGTEAQQLYAAYAWMAPVMEELLVHHVIVSPSISKDDEAPDRSLRDRYRGMAGGAFGKATAGGAPGEKGV